MGMRSAGIRAGRDDVSSLVTGEVAESVTRPRKVRLKKASAFMKLG